MSLTIFVYKVANELFFFLLSRTESMKLKNQNSTFSFH